MATISTPSPMSDDELFRHFEGQSLPKEQWTHRAHLKMAYLHLRRYSFDEALVRLREGIRALNASHQVHDTPTGGYHETMTHAWLRLVQVTLQQFGPAPSADEFFDAQPQLEQKRILLLFYSRDRIMSAEAKAGFIPPDLAPLPKACLGS